jgi:hypothetical protein
MDTSKARAARLLIEAGVSLRGPDEAATGTSRVDLAAYLLRWFEEEAEANDLDAPPVSWDAPLSALAGQPGGDAFDAGDWLACSEVGDVVVASEASDLRTFGDAVLYVEDRLSRVRWDATEAEVLGSLRQYLPVSEACRAAGELTAETPLEGVAPWEEASRSVALREHLTRQYGANLPYGENILATGQYQTWFFLLWGALLVGGGALLWRFGPFALAVWVAVSPFLAHAVVSRRASMVWPADARTLGDLVRHVRNASQVTRRRVADALKNEEDRSATPN